MMTFISTLKSAAQKRAAYSRTVAELQSMPLDVALDLGIYQGDVRKIARKAVYGA
jgi:uncharacterized protein YjiS (DUF1127 family)